MKTVGLLAGARPNYMKIFPVWRVMCAEPEQWRIRLIHTGQHYDTLMSDIFFTDLGMSTPDHFLGVGSGSHGEQTARVMMAVEKLLQQEPMDLLVVVGDVNSTLAGALVAVKMGVPVAHVEAGLRSGDRTMPEEINRIVADAVSDMLLTPSPDADDNLLREGIPAHRIHCVGNVMIDSLNILQAKAPQSSVLTDLDLSPRAYVAVTLHRPHNVDCPKTLRHIMEALEQVGTHWPVIFPVHPRTRAVMDKHNILAGLPGNVRLLEPRGYVDFLQLQTHARVVITDSGGIQEETTVLGVPCLTLRPNTERPITITQGTNRLIDLEQESLVDAVLHATRPDRPVEIPLWDGQAASRIVDVFKKYVET